MIAARPTVERGATRRHRAGRLYSADNPAAAEALVGRLRATFALLAENPLLGLARTEWAPELRTFVVGRYVILYRPIVGGVEIVRVVHGARYVPGLV